MNRIDLCQTSLHQAAPITANQVISKTTKIEDLPIFQRTEALMREIDGRRKGLGLPPLRNCTEIPSPAYGNYSEHSDSIIRELGLFFDESRVLYDPNPDVNPQWNKNVKSFGHMILETIHIRQEELEVKAAIKKTKQERKIAQEVLKDPVQLAKNHPGLLALIKQEEEEQKRKKQKSQNKKVKTPTSPNSKQALVESDSNEETPSPKFPKTHESPKKSREPTLGMYRCSSKDTRGFQTVQSPVKPIPKRMPSREEMIYQNLQTPQNQPTYTLAPRVQRWREVNILSAIAKFPDTCTENTQKKRYEGMSEANLLSALIDHDFPMAEYLMAAPFFQNNYCLWVGGTYILKVGREDGEGNPIRPVRLMTLAINATQQIYHACTDSLKEINNRIDHFKNAEKFKILNEIFSQTLNYTENSQLPASAGLPIQLSWPKEGAFTLPKIRVTIPHLLEKTLGIPVGYITLYPLDLAKKLSLKE